MSTTAQPSSTIVKPGPTPVPVTETFWSATKRHELLIQRCQRCGWYQHYPRPLCAQCWSRAVEWVRAAGRGTVWTFTVVHRPGHPAWAADVPYVLALVELSEGPRLLGNLLGIDPSEVTVGMPVEAVFTERPDFVLVNFVPASRPGD